MAHKGDSRRKRGGSKASARKRPGSQKGSPSATTQREDLLTMEEAVEQLKTSRPTLYRWVRQGKIKGIKVGRQWRFRPEDIERFMRGEGPAVELPVGVDAMLDGLRRALREAGVQTDQVEEVLTSEEPTIAAAQAIILLAYRTRSSDIHLQPSAEPGREPGKALLRLRIDGVLHKALEFDLRALAPLVAQFKRMTACDVNTKHRPQDGRLVESIDGAEVDLRVNFLPACYGEAVTARVLRRDAEVLSLDDMPLHQRDGEVLRDALAAPYGLIVIAGPAGSGKTTTLYAALQSLNHPHLKVITIEDPVEYVFPGMLQVQIMPREGLTFESALRSSMRADPDVIMLGEVRSEEALQICFQISLTGHLVLTTLHTNTAAGTLRRMLDLGADPFLIREAGRLVMAQRLVRRLCPHCSVEAEPDPVLLEEARRMARTGGVDLNSLPGRFRKAVGCGKCSQTGYRGRTCVVELMRITPRIAAELQRGASDAELTAAAVGEGMTTMAADGIRRAACGETTLEEVRRVTANL
ncbi:MAG: ATPase, T2SS/T4P/T4SS family [Phycisphaerae bacterium]